MLLLLVTVHRRGVFFSCSFPFLLAVCILDAFGHLVGREAGCNWYLRDINIFPLSKTTNPY